MPKTRLGKNAAAEKLTGAKLLALVVIIGCQLTLVVDATIVNIALPSIQRGLFSPNQLALLSWVVNAYTLAFGGLMLLGGRAGDILGHRRVFVAGMALFTVASLVGGFAATPEMLLAARAAQGLGAALAGPASLALINTSFAEGAQRSRAIAIFAATASVAMVVGLVLGGLLTVWTWRAVFFVNVPIGVAIAVLAPLCLGESVRTKARFDLAGALTATAGMTLLVYGFVSAAERGWTNAVTIAALVVAAVLLAAFVVVETRARQPILPLRLFADRDRAGAYAMRTLLYAAMSGMLFFLTIYVQTVLTFNPLETAFAFVPTTVAYIAASRAVPRLLEHFGPRPIMLVGAVVATAGMVWLTQVSETSTYVGMILGPVVLFGGGTGLVSVAATLVAMSAVPAGDSGAASGLIQATQQVGGSLGVAVLVTVYASVAAHGDRVSGIAAAFIAGVVFCGCLVVTALLAFARRKAEA